jgi:putative transposase
MLSLAKSKLVNLYKKENDSKGRKGLLVLIIKVCEDKQIPFHVVKEMHTSNPWASDWLKRYDKEVIEGLRTRQKSGKPSEISEEIMYQIKKELKENNKQGWTTKQVEELIIKKSGIKYHYAHIYCLILRKWGFKQKVPRNVHVNNVSMEEKDKFKKRSPRYLWMRNSSSRKNNNKKVLL